MHPRGPFPQRSSSAGGAPTVTAIHFSSAARRGHVKARSTMAAKPHGPPPRRLIPVDVVEYDLFRAFASDNPCFRRRIG